MEEGAGAGGDGLIKLGFGYWYCPGLTQVIGVTRIGIGAQDDLGPVDGGALDPAVLQVGKCFRAQARSHN